ncbi:MAG: urea ABC transporter permease subunit UrtB [Chloroflexota bacterium]|nr:urea ABC transporter permease subunit UrtB [Chloroflexota bacterium]
MELYLLQVFNGLSVGSILLLVALGLAFSFGLMGVINMAHGELIMIGAYCAYVAQVAMARVAGDVAPGVYFAVALVLAFFVAAAVGLALEILLIRRLYGRPLDTLLATWGVALMLQQLARSVFGAPNVQVISPAWLNGGLRLTPAVSLPYSRLFILFLAVACIGAVYVYLYRTVAGRRLRAAMQNRDMAACLGVATRRVDATTFALGSGLAGIAGCALALLGPVGPSLGTYYIVDAFMVVVLGGVGQLPGTILAALAIGGFNTAFEFGSTASLGKVLVFVLVIVFLQWKPAGFVALRSR